MCLERHLDIAIPIRLVSRVSMRLLGDINQVEPRHAAQGIAPASGSDLNNVTYENSP